MNPRRDCSQRLFSPPAPPPLCTLVFASPQPGHRAHVVARLSYAAREERVNAGVGAGGFTAFVADPVLVPIAGPFEHAADAHACGATEPERVGVHPAF